MDFMAITGAVSASAAAAENVTKLIGSVRDLLKPGKLSDTDIQTLRTQISDLFDVAITAKAAQFDLQQAAIALQAEKDALTSKVAKMEAFDAQAVEYELRAISPNSFAYLKKEAPNAVGQTPYLCVPCFDERHKAILQFAQADYGFDILKCPKCGTTVRVPVDRGAMVMFGATRRTKWDFDPFDN